MTTEFFNYSSSFKLGSKLELPEHKSQTGSSELLHYLEEFYHMDMLDEKEMDIYERYTYGSEITQREWKYVYQNWYKWFFVKF